jgi:agmatinase
MRHEGIVEGNYWSELTTEHMQPEAGEKGKAEGLSEEVDLNHAKSKK